MSTGDKAKHKVEELSGKLKEAAGKVMNDRSMVAHGKMDQMTAKVKQTGDRIKDAVRRD